MVDEDEVSLTTEFPDKVIQVQSPDESPPESVLLQVSDLDSTAVSPLLTLAYDGLQRRRRVT